MSKRKSLMDSLLKMMLPKPIDFAKYVLQEDIDGIKIGWVPNMPSLETVVSGPVEPVATAEAAKPDTNLAYVEVRNRKHADITSDSNLEWLFQNTTFGEMFGMVSDRWATLMEGMQTRNDAVMLKLPIRLVLGENGKPLSEPVKNAVILVIVPNKKAYGDISVEDYNAKCIDSAIDAIVKSGEKFVLINPFGTKAMCADPYKTARQWKEAVYGNSRVSANVECVAWDTVNDELTEVITNVM